MSEQTAESLGEIPYNPLNDTGEEPITVTVHGTEKTIHNTADLPRIIDAYLRYEQKLEPRDILERTFYETFETPHGQIIKEAIAKFFEAELALQPGSESGSQPEPALEAKLAYQIREICTLRNLERAARDKGRELRRKGLPISPEVRKSMLPEQDELNRRSYYYSQAFDVIVPIARSIAQEAGIKLSTTLICH